MMNLVIVVFLFRLFVVWTQKLNDPEVVSVYINYNVTSADENVRQWKSLQE